MARIALLTWGSHGDVLPFVALAHALHDAGHEVFIGAQPYHASFVRQHGLSFHALGGETSVERYQQLMEQLIDEPNPRKQMRLLLQEMLLSDLEAQYQDAMAALQGKDNAPVDLVVAHWMQLAGMAAAESLQIPGVTVSLNPVGIGVVAETAAARNLGKMLSDYVWGEEFHHFRARHGLPPVESVADYQYSKSLNLVAVSAALLPEREQYAPSNRITGFWSLKPAQTAANPAYPSIPENLKTFLQHPEKLVVFSFGSMGGRAGEMTNIVREAVRLAGCRAILQGGWAGLGAGEMEDEEILRVHYIPHDFLFSQAACIVHHGGAGTTAAALQAGVPSVIVWHMLDQPYWGNRLAELELGPRPLARLNLQPEELAARIREVLGHPAYTEHCRAVAKTLASQAGTKAAVREIEGFLSSGIGSLEAKTVQR